MDPGGGLCYVIWRTSWMRSAGNFACWGELGWGCFGCADDMLSVGLSVKLKG